MRVTNGYFWWTERGRSYVELLENEVPELGDGNGMRIAVRVAQALRPYIQIVEAVVRAALDCT